ncbi:sugar phosphate isomerase/epimerase family protein [Larsenimonas rhizosphaerae]|uniref:Sugar phosphate isomerase/epimerase n=1 Tax=Larsenimonas rhizosphaerae TaxID=2944682 RepID=A0AA42CYQ8_9GAMM|nr:sugar phosphate isomerase/epimerase [Larsenimonas rhizosphaerae]MCM2131216.1 sugar phosphate isomerase/epimerase [Larsenimonas rhizosphaerae]MCX2525425.1 sugar phosphate isomerase/epimerase [Larsenimonas rhizosphaerae]
MGPVFVCTSAFGSDTVRRLGQPAVLSWIADAGAAGVEIREELLGGTDAELEKLAALAIDRHLLVVYSAAAPLFDQSGTLDMPALRRAADRALKCGAGRLKCGLGHLPAAGVEAGADALARWLSSSTMPLTIENDQTRDGANPARHEALHKALAERLPMDRRPGATLDLGNGHWTDHDIAGSVTRMAPWIDYVHCKAAVFRNGGWEACVPNVVTRAHWSSLWKTLPETLPRAIEFPVPAEDVITLAHWIETLNELPKEHCA